MSTFRRLSFNDEKESFCALRDRNGYFSPWHDLLGAQNLQISWNHTCRYDKTNQSNEEDINHEILMTGLFMNNVKLSRATFYIFLKNN